MKDNEERGGSTINRMCACRNFPSNSASWAISFVENFSKVQTRIKSFKNLAAFQDIYHGCAFRCESAADDGDGNLCGVESDQARNSKFVDTLTQTEEEL